MRLSRSTMRCLSGAFLMFLVGFALAAFLGRTAHAQALMVATGNLKTGTYSKMFTELNRWCQPSTIGIGISQRETSGSTENVALLLNNQVNAAIVQSDLLFFSKAANTRGIDRIKTLFGLHPEELHFIARADTKTEGGWGVGKLKFGGQQVSYTTLADLKGRPIGAVGGSVLSARVVSQFAGLDLKVVEFPNNDALKSALLEGKVDAILVVGGAPHALVASLDKNYRLLPVGQDTQARLKDVYAPTSVGYDNLGQAGVPTVNTLALFVTRTYESQGMRTALLNLRRCMKNALPEIKDALGTHAKWQDVKADDDGKWPVYDLK